MKCKECKWWQDYTDRVYARVSKTKGNIGRSLIELRRCGFTPAPTISDASSVYTDEDFYCSDFNKKEE